MALAGTINVRFTASPHACSEGERYATSPHSTEDGEASTNVRQQANNTRALAGLHHRTRWWYILSTQSVDEKKKHHHPTTANIQTGEMFKYLVQYYNAEISLKAIRKLTSQCIHVILSSFVRPGDQTSNTTEKNSGKWSRHHTRFTRVSAACSNLIKSFRLLKCHLQQS